MSMFRSRDNTRSERLWVDMTRGIGHKWKKNFWQLEDEGFLDVDNETHLWLLHTLFIPFINYDLITWANVWNLHKMQIQGERKRSPTDMFIFGLIQDGIKVQADHGIGQDAVGADQVDDIPYVEEVIDEEEAVDFQDFNDDGMAPRGNPFIAPDVPNTLNRVDCDPPPCPLSQAQVQSLVAFLQPRLAHISVDMESRRQLWKDTMQFCGRLEFV